jgi:DNA-binding CsgD family transcriptional regulator
MIRIRLRTLTERQRDCLIGLAMSKPRMEIALEMGVSPKTVEYHTSNMARKLRLMGSDYAGMARIAIGARLIH